MSTTSPPREPNAVVAWRIEQLLHAGYPIDWAIVLGERVDVDLRTAIFLLESGCPLKTALLILT